MKTVRDACQLQPNALSIKLSDQVERDLNILVEKSVVEPRGKGRGVVYRFLRKRATSPPNKPGTSSKTGYVD